MRIHQNNVQSLSSALQQKMGQQQGVKTATDKLNSGARTGMQLADAIRMSEDTKTQFMQKNGIQKIENSTGSTVGLAAQSQTNSFLNAQNQGRNLGFLQSEGLLPTAEETKRYEEMMASIHTIGRGGIGQDGAVLTLPPVDGESSQRNQADSTQLQNAVAGNTENRAVKADGNTNQTQDLQQRFQSTLQAMAAGTYARVDKATQATVDVATNTNSTVTDVSVQEEMKNLTQFTAVTGEQTQTRPVLRQMGTAALSQANQATQQALSLMRG